MCSLDSASVIAFASLMSTSLKTPCRIGVGYGKVKEKEGLISKLLRTRVTRPYSGRASDWMKNNRDTTGSDFTNLFQPVFILTAILNFVKQFLSYFSRTFANHFTSNESQGFKGRV